MDWDKLKTFHAAAEAGSLTAAAERLQISQSAVSRQIGSLEETLGVSLFHRHARGLLLTEQGHILQHTTDGMTERVLLAEALLRDSRDKPFGGLRVTAPIAFGSIWLTPRLADFRRDYPEIILHLMVTDKVVDLNKLEADCALRLGQPSQQDLIQRKLFTFDQSLYASRDYISAHGMPNNLGDLDEHPIILYGATGVMRNVDWLEHLGRDNGKTREPAMTIDNIYALMKAVQSGVGIAGLPDYVAADNPALVRILPEITGPNFELYFAYPEELRRSKRVQAFSDFLSRQIRLWKN
ncbi:Transcriptional regulator, LysR family [hydrothermal vent metagenome]|uniref:Transcriptional regulator, LysR family n=1 Tax=hydrothermal vent metagenome TaxID=652676 RepID=A0A3B0R3T1_9ZZZZ